MADPVKQLDLLLGERRWLDDLARSLVRDRGVAEELAQEVWTRVLQREPTSVGEPGAVRAYLEALEGSKPKPGRKRTPGRIFWIFSMASAGVPARPRARSTAAANMPERPCPCAQ